MSDPGAVVRFYGRWAGFYDLIATRTPGIAGVRERAVDALALEPGDTVVEVGCGTGANLPILRDRVGPTGRVVGLDLTPGMLVRARRRIQRAGWENVHVVRGDAARPSLPDDSVDGVLATFVVGMLGDPGAVVARWTELVGSVGRIALLDAAPRNRRGPLDAAFGAFVAVSAPPTWQVRYDESPARRLGARVEAAREALDSTAERVVDERFAREFLRLTAAEL